MLKISSLMGGRERRYNVIKLVLVVLAIIAFMLDALHVTNPNISWTPLGFALVTAAVLLPL